MAFDDPGPLADLVVQQLGLGQRLQAIPAYPDQLAGATTAQVTQAWRTRFDPVALSSVGVYPATGPVVAPWPEGCAAGSDWTG